MTKRFFQLLPLILLAIVTTSLHAQARLAIYGTAGAEKSGLPYNPWKLAGTFGLYYGIIHARTRLYLRRRHAAISRAKSTAASLARALAIKLPVLPIKPYGEILFGVSSYPQTPPDLPVLRTTSPIATSSASTPPSSPTSTGASSTSATASTTPPTALTPKRSPAASSSASKPPQSTGLHPLPRLNQHRRTQSARHRKPHRNPQHHVVSPHKRLRESTAEPAHHRSSPPPASAFCASTACRSAAGNSQTIQPPAPTAYRKTPQTPAPAPQSPATPPPATQHC